MRSSLILFSLIPIAAAAGDWLEWRGPHFNGVADDPAPLEWSDSKNLAWKTPIPGKGNSTPVIAGDRIFLTTAITAADGKSQDFVLMAIHGATGAVLWRKTAATVAPHEGYHARYGSYASYAPITDGKLVWALFGSFGLYCYDLDGQLQWKKELPRMRMKMAFGEGGSPTLAGGRLILSLDQESGSFIIALDKTSGKELWRKDRDELSSWSTPLVHGQHVIVSASNKVRAYDLASGDVVWECSGLGANVIPAPVVANDIVIVMSGFRNPNLLAIRLGRKGDLTGSDAIVWTNQRGNSYTPSPVLHEGKLYFVTDSGMVTCVNAATGEAYYRQQRLPKSYNFKASPIAASGRLYLATEEGDVVVLKLGEQYEVLATNALSGQSFIASPIATGGALYLRSQEALFCLRSPNP